MTDSSPWYQQSWETLSKQLNSGAEGLSQDEATKRLAEYGPNRLEGTRKRSPWIMFFRQFHNLLIYVLLVAALATALLQHWMDTIVIITVVVINSIIGFIQEGKAEKSMEAVRNMLAPHAMVRRDGVKREIDAADLVPGDRVYFGPGDRIPADIRLLKSQSLRIDEAILTGESVPVDKETEALSGDLPIAEQRNMAWSGTLVASGQGSGLVVATGIRTEIGKVSELLSQVSTLTTPLLRQLEVFGRQLTVAIILLAAGAFALGYWVQDFSASEMFMAAVGLAVAAIPEGLPAVVTIILALGVQSMARNNAIVRRLPAVETLGSVTVICSDKTGTLTRNEMTATASHCAGKDYQISGSGYNGRGEISPEANDDLHDLLQAAILCSDAEAKPLEDDWHLHGDPTEMALLVAAIKGGHKPHELRRANPRRDLVPFDSAHKFMASLHQKGLLLVKGAPEILMERCSHQRMKGEDQPLDADYWQECIERLAQQGLRTLALARRHLAEDSDDLDFDEVRDCTLLGLVGLLDPPREEAIAAVAQCQQAGIRVKMITGDHSGTAKAIAGQLGLNKERALTGRQLDAMSPEELRVEAARTDVFARVSPENKLQLVTALQAEGHTVAMTGDGVNDSPALKRADIGVAMGQKGTEAAKEASEIVLADDNFASIGRAVREGRIVYANIRKCIGFIAPTNGGQALTIIAAIVLGMTIPVTPLHILWVNMVTAVTLALALAFEPGEDGIMKQPPRPQSAGLVDGFMLWRIAFVSLLMVSFTFGLFFWATSQGADLASARTLAVNTLVMLEIFYLFNARFMTASSFSLHGFIGNRYCWYAVGAVLLLQLSFTYLPWMQTLFDTRPMPLNWWLLTVAGGLVVFMAVELEKFVVRSLIRR